MTTETQVNTETKTQVTGYDSLEMAVRRDCEDHGHCGCFNPNGCDVPGARKDGKSCFHAYCDKFKWTVDRAKHYAEKLGLDWMDVLTSWEENRTYWYMNYYQDANQPEIKGDDVRVFESVEEMKRAIGAMEFRCPACNGISTSPYACNSGVKVSGKVCDWKVYGLFGGLGKGVFVYCKDKLAGETIFMPVSWEK